MRYKAKERYKLRCRQCSSVIARQGTNYLYKACPRCLQVAGKAGWEVLNIVKVAPLPAPPEQGESK